MQPLRRWVMLFYLAQLVIPAIYLIAYARGWQLAFGACLLLLFGFCYSQSFTDSQRRRLVMMIVMMTLMWALAWWGSAGFLFLIYYPAAIASYLPGWRLAFWYTLLIAGSLLEVLLLIHRYHVNVAPYLPEVLGSLLGVFSMTFMLRMYGRLHMTNRKLAKANEEIERLTKTAERERISRDLHDVMGHQLSMITLKAQVAAKLLEKGRDATRAHSEVLDIEKAAREALTQVRAYVSAIKQADFDEEWAAAQTLLQAAKIECSLLSVPGDRKTKNHPVYQVLAMCLREAVTNIVRHSGAKRAFLGIEETAAGEVHLWVADDGRGVKHPAQRPTADEAWQGNGIKGMRARVAAVGGQLQFWSAACQMGAAANVLGACPIPWPPSVIVHVRAPLVTEIEMEEGAQ